MKHFFHGLYRRVTGQIVQCTLFKSSFISRPHARHITVTRRCDNLITYTSGMRDLVCNLYFNASSVRVITPKRETPGIKYRFDVQLHCWCQDVEVMIV